MLINGTFQGKLLKFVLSVTCISILLVVLYGVHYFRKKDEINNVIDRINKLDVNLIMDIKSQTDFIKYDAVDTNFHKKGTSAYIETHKMLRTNIDEIISSFKRDNYTSILNIHTDLDSLVVLLNQINMEFENIIIDTKVRGFKDFGTEGEMRKYAHMLENAAINQTTVLSLRRHEKDYIIRKEPVYIEELNKLGAEFKNYIDNRFVSKTPYKDSINALLTNYLIEFNEMVKLEEKIGLFKGSGIIQNLERLFEASVNIIESINNKAYLEKNLMFRKLGLNAIWFIVVLISINIIVSIYLSKHITKPLQRLTSFITSVTKNNFRYCKFPDFENSDNEIFILITEFKEMLVQLQTREKERDVAEAALRENETRYRNLADMLPQSIFEADSDCNLTYFNKTMASVFRYNTSDSKPPLKISDILNTDCETLMESENTSGIDYVARKQNGEEFPVLLYASKIIKNNIISGLRGIMVDITEKKQYTEELKEQKLKAEQADRLKSAFLANMSHEIRTPLNSIVGFSQILSSSGMDERTKLEYAGYIRNSSDLLLKIINDILDIAKIESGQLKITYSDFDINSLVDKIEVQANEIKKNSKKDFLEIRMFKYFKSKEFNIYSDHHRLEQVLINLISNAIKFTMRGIIEIGYNATETHVEFFVKDTGIGISDEMQKSIFDRFVQVEEPNKKIHDGTGLGLSICKSIIELLGGRIWVRSCLDQGSIFYFEIPLIIHLSPVINQIKFEKKDIDYNSFIGEKILIAEDIDFNFLFLHEGLKPLGLSIIRAFNGAEAIEIIKSNPDISLILMDMRMPEIDGYEASQRIKAINPAVSIIATTANAITGDKEKCIAAGCDYYMSKPIKIEELIEMIGLNIINKSTSHTLEPNKIA